MRCRGNWQPLRGSPETDRPSDEDKIDDAFVEVCALQIQPFMFEPGAGQDFAVEGAASDGETTEALVHFCTLQYIFSLCNF